MQFRAYKFKLKPNKIQQTQLLRTAGARRFIYNWSVASDRKEYEETKKGLSAFDLSYRLTELKTQEGVAWLKEINAQTLLGATEDFYSAKQRFFKKLGRLPTFKSKHKDRPRFKTRQGTKLEDNKVRCPSIGWIKVQKNRQPEGIIKSGHFKQDACGDWWVSIVVEVSDVSKCEPFEAPVGIDLGLKDFIVTSDGHRIQAPQIFRKNERKLARAQRTFCRRQLRSNRRKAAKLIVAKLHRKIANTRNFFQHKISIELVKQYSLICIETLNLKGLAKTKLAKSFLDAGLGEFVRQLKYKAEWNGTHVVPVDRWFPSSKLCSCCGTKNDALTLSDRHWICQACGASLDRDMNAALNLKNEGMRMVALGYKETENGRGADVRLPLLEAIGCEASMTN